MRIHTQVYRLSGLALIPIAIAAVGVLAPSHAAAQFPSDNVSLHSWIDLSTFGATDGNDCWGYVSPSGREYALMGLNNKVAFVEITDPANPEWFASISHASSIWADIKVYENAAYVVTEARGTGIQVIDLSNIDSHVVTLIRTVLSPGRSHNIAVDTVSGFLYSCGSRESVATTVIFNLGHPLSPRRVGSWSGAYEHDVQVVTYTSGPFAGRQIMFGASEGRGLDVIDVTDKANVFLVSRTPYPNVAYCHQLWTGDLQHLYVNDELDSIPRITVFDISDLTNPIAVSEVTTGLAAIDHNLYVRDGFIFEANYRSGLRIFDANTDPVNPTQVGWFDTYPANDNSGFDGAWSCYPFFPSGTVIVSDINRGLFVLDVSAIVPAPCPRPAFPSPEPGPVDKNRYVSFKPGNPGRQIALRVSFTDLPPLYDALEGAEMWVDAPTTVSSSDGPLRVARLRCDPLYRDWQDVDVLHLLGRELLPNATYTLRAYEEVDCGQGLELAVSISRAFHTSPTWGDLVGGAPGGPDGTADFEDISALVDAFQGMGSAPDVTVADLAPGLPDQVVDFVDISAGVEAFQGAAFPYSGPAACQ